MALAASAALTSCDDNFTYPPVIMPPCVDVVPTTTLEDFKADYWSYLSSCTDVPYLENGDTIVFTGRVCSSDETGNIFKNIIIQTVDPDGEQVAITFSVDEYDLYKIYPIGQEVAVYASGMAAGGYRNLFSMGANGSTEVARMSLEEFQKHVVRNHFPLPQPQLIDTTVTTIPEVVAAKSDNAQLLRWQSRIIRIDNVSWEEQGQPYAPTATVNRYIVDENGNRLVVRCSNYASFHNDLIPAGTGSVTGILSYYASDWQLLLNDLDGLEGFTPAEAATPSEPAGAGTASDPYNVTRALEVISSGSIPADKVYVKGTITSVSELSTSFGNATYAIADQAGGTSLTVFRGYWLNGDKFTSEDQLTPGMEVVVYGNLMSYNGSPQIGQGSQIVPAGGDTPAQGETLYTFLPASLTELPSDWTLDQGTLAEGLSYIWSWKVYQNSGYLTASAFFNNVANPAEAYAISPVIDLTGVTGAAANFEHAAKFQTTLKELCGMVAREEDASEWTELTIPTWPAEGAWTFVNSGAVDLSAFDGKKIQVAFKYGSSAEGADTWEIKNLAITGTK